MKILFIILSAILLFTCEKTEQSYRITPDTSGIVDSLKIDSSFSVEELEQAPSWFKSLPEKEGYIYATGTAKSRRANIASNKALLNAQVSLAEKLKEMGLGSNIIHGEQSIGADSDLSNDNLSITMQDVMIKNKKQIKSGNLWYSFVLLELKQDK